MMSLRVFTRSIPRSVFKTAIPSTCRPLSTIRKPSLLQSSWKVASRPAYQAFSTTPFRSEPAGEVDFELSAKIKEEASLENESSDSSALPESLQDYLENGPFELKENAGDEEVVLTRKFGNETIRVTFSISDLNALDQEPEGMEEDDALYDEDVGADLQQGGAQSKGAINSGRTSGGNIAVAPEDSISPADRPELADEEDIEPGPSFPARINVTIEKPGKGAVQVQTVAQDGTIMIEDVYYFPKADLADAQTAEKDWARRNMYAGPPFANLDEELQLLMERYLEERGINTALAHFVPEYIEHKEQKEYVNWLQNMKNFVDA